MKQFDYYEFTAILVPGSTFLITMGLIFPDVFGERFFEGVSLGDLGIFVIAAYVSGHVVQAFSSLYEKVFWRIWGGMPTEWALKNGTKYYTAEQVDLIKKKVQQDMKLALNEDGSVPKSVTRQIYSILKNNKQTERVDIFNANYGLNRAMAASSLLGFLISLFFLWDTIYVSGCLLLATILLTYRMFTFALNYSHAIYNGFLNVRNDA